MKFKFNHSANRSRSALLILVAISFFVVGAAVQAATATLDAKATKNLMLDHVWQMKLGSGHAYWSWKSDGSVCFRVEAGEGKCADTGSWKLDGNRLCYDLTWWGASGGFKSSCFRVSNKGKGWYEAVEDNGVTLFEFSAAK